jgi:DNA-binding PadR family transcriptional regulator
VSSEPGAGQKREFNADERASAAQAFEELRSDGYLQATYRDLADPENWVTITSSGKEFLSRDLKDREEANRSAAELSFAHSAQIWSCRIKNGRREELRALLG